MENVKQSQEAQILKDLLEGKKITQLDAIYAYGVARLSARIFQIRKTHPIKGEMIAVRTRTGNKRVMLYSYGR